MPGRIGDCLLIVWDRRVIREARAQALANGDQALARNLRRQYHGMNHTLRTSAKRAMLR